MTAKVNTILERVLSQELARQEVWLQEDKAWGQRTNVREEAIKEIKAFMEQENIKFRQDYYQEEYEMCRHEDVEEV